MTKVVLVDVDGTLADCSHRQGYVRSKPKNWKAFKEGLIRDLVHEDVVWLVKTLHSAGCIIIIVTAREGTDRCREDTIKWLDDVAGLKGVYTGIYFRKVKDYREDSIVKMEILEQIKKEVHVPFMVLDDRDRVVSAWRSAGIRCLQVAPGDF